MAVDVKQLIATATNTTVVAYPEGPRARPGLRLAVVPGRGGRATEEVGSALQRFASELNGTAAKIGAWAQEEAKQERAEAVDLDTSRVAAQSEAGRLRRAIAGFKADGANSTAHLDERLLALQAERDELLVELRRRMGDDDSSAPVPLEELARGLPPNTVKDTDVQVLKKFLTHAEPMPTIEPPRQQEAFPLVVLPLPPRSPEPPSQGQSNRDAQARQSRFAKLRQQHVQMSRELRGYLRLPVPQAPAAQPIAHDQSLAGVNPHLEAAANMLREMHAALPAALREKQLREAKAAEDAVKKARPASSGSVAEAIAREADEAEKAAAAVEPSNRVQEAPQRGTPVATQKIPPPQAPKLSGRDADERAVAGDIARAEQMAVVVDAPPAATAAVRSAVSEENAALEDARAELSGSIWNVPQVP